MRKISMSTRKKNIEYHRQKRLALGVVPLGTEILCEECSLPLIKSSSKRKLHKECNDKRQNECNRRIRNETKIRVLIHYNKNEKLNCFWEGCAVCDPDMLCLDHLENDGHKERKKGLKGGYAIYSRLEKAGLPEGFQTLCFNHNMKKRFLAC